MLRSIARAVRAITHPRSVSAPRRLFGAPGLRFRPRVEGLEARDVPATICVWNGGGDPSDPTAYDDAENWIGHQIPKDGDEVVFDGLTSNGPCADLATDKWGPLNSVRLKNGYSGTVTIINECDVGTLEIGSGSVLVNISNGSLLAGTVSMTGGNLTTDSSSPLAIPNLTLSGGTLTIYAALTVGTLTLSGGTLDTPAGGSGNDVTVYNTFNWTGGTLNSTANETTVNILGDGTIILPTGGTLSCGSALNFAAADPDGPIRTTTISGAGALNFFNGSPVTVDAAYSLILANAPGATGRFTGPQESYDIGKATITLKQGGTLTVKGPGVWSSENRTLNNSGGSLVILDGATAEFGLGGLFGPPVGTPIKTDILQSSGTISIDSGCTLTSSWGAMVVQSGNLYANPAADGGTSTIGCQLTISGGTIAVQTNFGTLSVSKNCYWTGGTVTLQAVELAASGSGGNVPVAV